MFRQRDEPGEDKTDDSILQIEFFDSIVGISIFQAVHFSPTLLNLNFKLIQLFQTWISGRLSATNHFTETICWTAKFGNLKNGKKSQISLGFPDQNHIFNFHYSDGPPADRHFYFVICYLYFVICFDFWTEIVNPNSNSNFEMNSNNGWFTEKVTAKSLSINWQKLNSQWDSR